jgi:hypothetical protein
MDSLSLTIAIYCGRSAGILYESFFNKSACVGACVLLSNAEHQRGRHAGSVRTQAEDWLNI